MTDTFPSRPKPGRFLASEEARKRRVESLKTKTGDSLLSLSFSGLEAGSTVGNIENYIGTIQIPMGLAGPLEFNFRSGKEKITAPIATTEAALISSISRGAIAISTSGGVTTRVLGNRMTRAPAFHFKSLDESIEFSKWLRMHFLTFASLVERKSRYAKLTEIDPRIFGKSVHVRFVYTTGNAAGQNMTTFCTSMICDWILKKIPQDLGFECLDFFIEGNLSSDKKVSHLSASQGRGRTVIAEATIKSATLKRVLKTTAPRLVQQFNSCKSNRIYSGMVGFNINVANVVAGLFLSTGQDMACVHECSVGELHMECQGDDLYASLLMPSIVVGTVGGGTHLPGPRDSLKILGCTGENSADRLSEIVAGFALALELSTTSAISGGQFVHAHEKSARTSTVHWMKISDLSVDFFNKHLDKNTDLVVKEMRPINELDIEHGHVTDLAFQVSKKFSGLLAFELNTENTKNNKKDKLEVFLKVKPRDYEVVQGAARILSVLDPVVSQSLVSKSSGLPFKNCHRRELQATKFLKNSNFLPQYLGSFEDEPTETYVIIQQFLNSSYLISPVNQLEVWTQKNRKMVYEAISQLHTTHAKSDLKSLVDKIPDLYYLTENQRQEMKDLWAELKDISVRLMPPDSLDALNESWEQALQAYTHHEIQQKQLPHTLIHNDFNPRNIALYPERDVKFFDWEFLSWGLPQRDLVEFMVFAIDSSNFESSFKEDSDFYFDKYFKSIYSIKGLDKTHWEQGLRIAYEDFLVARLPFYIIISQFAKCEYLDRVIQNLEKLGRMYAKSS